MISSVSIRRISKLIIKKKERKEKEKEKDGNFKEDASVPNCIYP